VLERLTRNFRLLLSAFDGGLCPPCAVRTTLEMPEVERVRSKGEPGTALCGNHLESYFGSADSRPQGLGWRVRLLRR